jgi:hypothetical protein
VNGNILNATGELMKPNDTHMDMSEIGQNSVDAGEGGKMRAFYLNDHARNLSMQFKSNYIRTTKYTAATFLPLCLF